jgi:transposase InsO family protein
MRTVSVKGLSGRRYTYSMAPLSCRALTSATWGGVRVAAMSVRPSAATCRGPRGSIDIASRRVVGFALADHLRTELIAGALSNAVAARDPEPGVIFHSDRGCQYTSAALADECEVTLSVGRTGQCWDNALAESFFSSLKGELIDTRAWPTRTGARRAVVEYIGWYNGTRLHSSLGYQSPADYEDNHHENVRQVA